MLHQAERCERTCQTENRQLRRTLTSTYDVYLNKIEDKQIQEHIKISLPYLQECPSIVTASHWPNLFSIHFNPSILNIINFLNITKLPSIHLFSSHLVFKSYSLCIIRECPMEWTHSPAFYCP